MTDHGTEHTTEHRKIDFRTLQYLGEEGKLIPLLQRAQTEEGYISRARIAAIHDETGIPLAQIYGVATFYAQFRLQPVGKHICRVCHGTACHVSGADGITEAMEAALEVKTGDTTADREFTLETVSCLGCCSLAPVLMIDSSTYANVDPNGVKKIIRQHRQASQAPAGKEVVKP